MFTNDNTQRRRVVVTGLGLITALGNDVASTWQNLIAGHCGITPITKFDATGYPCQLAAEVHDFDPLDYMDKRDARRLSTVIHYAVGVAKQAVAHANLDISQEESTRIGVEIGTGLGGSDWVEEQRMNLEKYGVKKVHPISIPAMLLSSPSCFVSIQLGLQGPVHAPVSACATGITAIGEAMRRIIWGDAEVMIAGSTEGVISPFTLAAFGRIGALTSRNSTPTAALTPFDATRDGIVIGEGAGALVLESLEHAQARHATILAEVKGYGFSSDAYHISAPRSDGQGAERAMRHALRDAGIGADRVDYIAAHGTGTSLNDAIETKAIKQALGEELAYQLKISSIKSMVGHTLGAAGAIAAVATIQAMQTGLVPPTINLYHPDPVCDLDYVPNETQEYPINTALVNGFGFGGQNACIVLQKWSES